MRTDEEFRAFFKGTAIVRAKREGLVRNAAVVAANTGSADLLDALLESAERDPSGVVRRHALWAAAVLGDRERDGALRRVLAFVDRVDRGDDEALQEELRELSTQLPNLR